MGSRDPTILPAHLCAVALGAIHGLPGCAFGGSKERAPFLAAIAASLFRSGHLAVPNGALYQSCHGRQRFCLGRSDDDRPVGDRPRVLPRVRSRRVFHPQELLGSCMCLQLFVYMCEGRFVVLQVDAHNLLGIVNRGSSKLPINELARVLFWFCLHHRITISRWNGFPVRRTHSRMRSLRCSSRRAGCSPGDGFSTWNTDGVPTRWTSSRLTPTTSALGCFPYTGVGARRVSMHLDNIGMGRIAGLTALSV